MSTRPALPVEKLVEYGRQRERVADQFEAMGRGHKMTAALAINIAPARVYQVLNGHAVEPAILDALEGWLADREAIPA